MKKTVTARTVPRLLSNRGLLLCVSLLILSLVVVRHVQQSRVYWKWELLLLISKEYPWSDMKTLRGFHAENADLVRGLILYEAFIQSYWLSGRYDGRRTQHGNVANQVKRIRLDFAESIHESQISVMKNAQR
jgi:hypothetical protein